jgi:hypothetical protein
VIPEKGAEPFFLEKWIPLQILIGGTMEFPEEILSHIRVYSRPRIGKEAREEYERYVKLRGPALAVLRAMVTPEGITVVREYNSDKEYVEQLLRSCLYTPFSNTKAAVIRRLSAERDADLETELQALALQKAVRKAVLKK